MRHRLASRTAVAAAASLLVASVAAQTAPASPPTAAPAEPPAAADADKPVVIAPVTVSGQRGAGYTTSETASATKLTLSPRETPQSITVITRQRLDDQKLTSLRQVLDITPGVYSNAYDTERVLFYARGFLIDTLMYDGVPATTNFNTGSIDETLDTALYDRIEVVRGATGLMTGAGNPAASINLVRKHADSRTATASLDLSVGSWSNRRAELDATVPLSADGRIRARGVAVIEGTDSYQSVYHKRRNILYGIVDADLAPATRVSLGFDYQENKPRGNTWGSFPLFLGDGSPAHWPTSVTTAPDWSYWDRKTQTVFGELQHRFDNGWTLRSTLSRRTYKEDTKLFYVFGFPDPVTGEGLEPSAYRSKGKITETSLDVHAVGPFELMGRRHELVLGYNGSRAKNVGTEQEPAGDLAPVGNFFQWNGNYPEPAWAESTAANHIKTDQDAVYAAARLSLTDSLKLIGGSRYGRWKVDSFYVYDTPENSRYDYSKAIPYAGLVWDVLPEFSVFTSYTGIFKPQNSRDLNGHYLDPIDGTSMEIGIKGEHFNKRLNTALTLFRTKQNNVAAPVFDPETGEPLLLPDGSPVAQGVDGTRTRGFEFEVAGRLADGVQASLGWTRYLTKDADGQTIRTFIPNTQVRLFATWEAFRWVPGLTLGGGLNWQSASSTAVGSPDGGAMLRQGSVTNLSLMAKYQVSPKVSVQLNGNNLLDRKYFVLDQFDNTYYGAPENYSVSLRVAY
jgi:outer membrane receptor for ferric coprogen and ferric-rhodotorulic acid